MEERKIIQQEKEGMGGIKAIQQEREAMGGRNTILEKEKQYRKRGRMEGGKAIQKESGESEEEKQWRKRGVLVGLKQY